jgi:hypothetical protein
MGDWVATAIFGATMGAQAAVIAAGRASLPATAGLLHDRLDGYAAAMALLAGCLLVSAVLVAASGRRHAPDDHRPG